MAPNGTAKRGKLSQVNSSGVPTSVVSCGILQLDGPDSDDGRGRRGSVGSIIRNISRDRSAGGHGGPGKRAPQTISKNLDLGPEAWDIFNQVSLLVPSSHMPCLSLAFSLGQFTAKEHFQPGSH